MSLRHAILTALVERPSSGLDLARRFDRSIGYFWPATHQQIYRELAALERDGLVATAEVASTRGRARTYAVLPAGSAELRSWITDGDDLRPVRDPLFVRLRAQAALGGDAEGLTAELERHRNQHAQRLTEFEAIEARDFAAGDPAEQVRLQHLILRAGIGLEQHWLQWLDQALTVASPSSSARPHPPQEDA